MSEVEGRVRQLELHAYGIDIKLDTLIESVKETSEVVRRLAEISHVQTAIQERLLGLQAQHDELSRQFQARQEATNPVIEKGNHYMSSIKTWGLVLGFIITFVHGFLFWSMDSATSYIQSTRHEIYDIRKDVEVIKTKIETSPKPLPSTS